MVSCQYTLCIHNKENKCTREAIVIDYNWCCNSCEFPFNPDDLFENANERTKYLNRKKLL